jgi:hypothetical protein
MSHTTGPRPYERLFTLRCGVQTITCVLRRHSEDEFEALLIGDGKTVIGRRFSGRALAVEWVRLHRAVLVAEGWNADE